jgi:hypothetical protein
MSKRIFAMILTTTVLLCMATGTWAAEAKQMVLGGYYNNGLALVAGDGYEDLMNRDRDYRTPKFSVGGGAYFDFYFNRFLAIEGGLGFLSKGVRYSRNDISTKTSVVYMEMPVMAKINFKGFQAAVGFALFVALSGRTVTKDDDDKTTSRWNDDEWDYYHRANIGPKIVLGYAIPVGPVFIVPGMSWMIHLINDLDSDEIKDELYPLSNRDFQARATNLMFFAAVEWIIPR